jgi:hypothetical protein
VNVQRQVKLHVLLLVIVTYHKTEASIYVGVGAEVVCIDSNLFDQEHDEDVIEMEDTHLSF